MRRNATEAFRAIFRLTQHAPGVDFGAEVDAMPAKKKTAHARGVGRPAKREAERIQQVAVGLAPDVAAALEALALEEERPRASMGARLIAEALRARGRVK
jgi:hypothetical protein